ncbi:MAG: hypothetical protein ACTSXG_03365 [Alphaproteobacteria bacterium]
MKKLLIVIVSFLSFAIYASSNIRVCTKSCENIVKKLFKKKYEEIHTTIKGNEKQLKQFIILIEKNYKSRIGKATGAYKQTLESELDKLKIDGFQGEHLDRISQIDPMNNDWQIIRQFGNKSALQENGKIFTDYKSPMEAGMACIAQCRDPDGSKSGWNKEKTNIYAAGPNEEGISAT